MDIQAANFMRINTSGVIYSINPEDYAENVEFEPISSRTIFYANNRTDKRLFGVLNFEKE